MVDGSCKQPEQTTERRAPARHKARLRRLRWHARRAVDLVSMRPQKPVRPSFIIGGTQKGGTTSLDAWLRQHPGICMADVEEVNFFCDDRQFSHGKPNYSIYHAHFSPSKPDCILGESSVSYMFWPEVSRRVFQYSPAMKWIILLRNPIDRAYSSWNMNRHRGTETLSFHEAIHAEPERCRGTRPIQDLRFEHTYVARGMYTEQLRRLWHFFPKNQTLVLKSDDLFSDSIGVLERVTDFLGVAPFENVEVRAENVSPYKERMSDEDRRFLEHLYEYPIKDLELMLGWDCANWFEQG